MASPVYYIQITPTTGKLYSETRAECEEKCVYFFGLDLLQSASFDHVVCLSLLQQGEQLTRNIYECSAAEDRSQRNSAAWTLSGSPDG